MLDHGLAWSFSNKTVTNPPQVVCHTFHPKCVKCLKTETYSENHLAIRLNFVFDSEAFAL